MSDTYKYPVGSSVQYLRRYKWGNFRTLSLIVGKITNHQKDGRYIIDPWASGHYGHKCFMVEEDEIFPTALKIKELEKEYGKCECPKGWNASSEKMPQ